MKKFLGGLIKLALLLCIAAVVLYLKAPHLLPEPAAEFMDDVSAQVQQLAEEYGGEIDPELWAQESGLFSGLEQIRAVGNVIAEDVADTLEDTGITGDSYSFDTTWYPYYGMLTETEQALYRQVYANVSEYQTTFVPCRFVSVDEATNAVMAVYYDHPELFWLDSGFSYRYYETGLCAQVIMEFNETYDRIDEASEQFAARAAELLEVAGQLESDLEKEKYIHDALVESVEYDLDAAANQSAYSALVNGETVCAGYARAYQYLMTELGIPTYYCVGDSQGDHAWNIVRLEDGYYNVDVTWDDASDSYDYFNRTDEDLSESHVRMEASVNLPACTAVNYRS